MARRASTRPLSAFGSGESVEPEPEAPAAQDGAPDALTVSAFVRAAKGLLEDAPGLQDTWVRGEVRGFRAYPSGHWYFSVKDDHAELSCVMFSGRNRGVRFEPEDGMDVLLKGGASVYQVRGQFQFQVAEMEPAGAGALWVAFEQLRERLADEGLFDDARKRHLPFLPRTIGVVTSRAGAVWHDIRNVALRRHPGVHLVLAPVRVQGDGAAREVAAAVERFNRHDAADVLIVGRGGGSMEDLWAFNEETVVRAIAASRIPVVSAVGHETDWTLADYTADVRAATPSQAAELAVPEAAALAEHVHALQDRSRLALRRRVADARSRFERVASSAALARPERILSERRQRVDDAHARLARAVRERLRAGNSALAERAGKLDALSPLAVLARGFAVARRAADGRVVHAAGDVAEGDDVVVRVARGGFTARVTRVESEEEEDSE